MIKEDYCSFEVARLLKEKGFDEKTLSYYENNVLCHGDWFEWNRSPLGHIAAPTHQMAMAWLREVHNITIAIKPAWAEGDKRNSVLWRWETVDMETIKRDYNGVIHQFSYEEAVEAALFYTLENLI